MRPLVPLLILTGLLVGCANEKASLSPDGPVPGTGASLGTTAPATPDPSTGFNPFSDQPATPPGGREVIANPSLADVITPGSVPEMSLGRPDAPAIIIKYASLTCPHCRAFQRDVFPQLKREYIDTGKVRFIIREFPIGKTSGTATIALRCAPPEKYFELYSRYLESQPAWVSQEVRSDAIFAVAQQVGMTRVQFDQCLQNQGMIEALKAVKERGRKLGVIGTPNFFIQNKLVKKTLTIDGIRAMVDPLLGGVPATAHEVPAR